LSLHYRLSGAEGNPVVIFLHGFMGSSRDWTSVISKLQTDYRCLAIDLPGHGRSVACDAYSFENVLTEVLTICEELGVDRFWLVGYSMGGRVSLYLAKQMRDRISGLVLESVSPGIENAAERVARRDADDVLCERLEQGPLSVFLEEWYTQPMFANLQQKPDLLKSLLRLRLDNDPSELASALRGMSVGRQPDLWNVLEDLPFPVLAITGGLDTKYVGIYSRINNAKKVVIPETGHNVHLENPASYIKAVVEFLNSHAER